MNRNQLKAVEIACQVMGNLKIKAGQTEKEIAAWIKHEISQRGAKLAFDTIVASGPRSIDPHARPSGKKIKNGEHIMVDLGAKYLGYCSDITRTFYVGRRSAKFQHLFSVVAAAQERAIAVVKDGAYCREIDIAAREYIKRCSGGCFIHSTGHGIGRKVHQEPRISLKSRKKLKAAMVITVEPGIYLKGWGGVRIEDMVLVTKKGGKILTR
ncbi:MAG: M24 family metallopeptidase [Candidatus Margulisbacteria bacterium]|nr:M24 family metallopeptidase [Candidatus Margulisiibacteriota bacterium]